MPPDATSDIVVEGREKRLFWAHAHVATANDCADELVGNAVLKRKTAANYDCFPLLHDGFAQYLHRFKLKNSPYCIYASDKFQDLLHVLEGCPIFLKERAESEADTGVRIVWQNFLVLLHTVYSRNINKN
ncbi:hypothetical protein EVAR_7708_1 [Eumeta japonica]|uniref:Uncharacterized protein n=1 Tax=Eumeta variegata TaxID=151549 RepID=A0A4C1TL05_EUMVA|nr:hypothetical protein EVAR_7708_1 [Eumeta japonica]